MRLVIANNLLYLWGGAEKVVLDQVDLFRRKGHEVFPFAQAHPLNRKGEDDRDFPPHNGYDPGSFLSNLPRFFRFLYSSANRHKFRRFLERVKPDLLHVHNLYGGLTTGILDAAREAGVPVVLTLHDYKLISPSTTLLSGTEPCGDCLRSPGTFRCLLRRCRRAETLGTFVYFWETWFNRRFDKYRTVRTFIAPSRFLADKVVAAGWDPGNVRIVPNALDPDRYPPGSGKGGYFFYCGRMSEEKGVEALLRHFSRGPHRLILAGDGRKLPYYRPLVKGRPNIRFLGQIGQEEIKPFYRDATAVIVPSLWPENCSMVVLEALASGRPVVASRMGGLPEQVEDGVNGFLFDPRDPAELGRILDRLSSEPALVAEMGRNARRIFEERYGEERYYDGLMGIYAGILKDQGRRG